MTDEAPADKPVDEKPANEQAVAPEAPKVVVMPKTEYGTSATASEADAAEAKQYLDALFSPKPVTAMVAEPAPEKRPEVLAAFNRAAQSLENFTCNENLYFKKKTSRFIHKNGIALIALSPLTLGIPALWMGYKFAAADNEHFPRRAFNRSYGQLKSAIKRLPDGEEKNLLTAYVKSTMASLRMEKAMALRDMARHGADDGMNHIQRGMALVMETAKDNQLDSIGLNTLKTLFFKGAFANTDALRTQREVQNLAVMQKLHARIKVLNV